MGRLFLGPPVILLGYDGMWHKVYEKVSPTMNRTVGYIKAKE